MTTLSLLPSQPLVVASEWGRAGFPAIAALFAAVAAAALLYFAALRRTRNLRLRAVVAGCVVGLALAWFSPVLFSSDVYAYAAYGEMARIGHNPYALAPAYNADTIVRAAQRQWVSAFPICTYGPAFVAFARAIVTAFMPLGLRAQLDAFRVAACAALVLCAMLAYWAYAGDRVTRLRAAATIGLNPVAIWCAVEGHNDSLALMLVLAGFVLVRRHFAGLGAAVIAFSALVKAPGIAAAIALAGINSRARLGAVAGIIIAVALSIPLLTGIAHQLAPHGQYAPQASVQAVFAPLGPPVAVAFAAIVALALVARGVATLRRGSNAGWIWLGLGGWALVPNPYPWYSLWLLALAALAPRTRIAGVAIALSFSSLLRYIPDAIGTPGSLLSVLLGVAASLPLLGLVPVRRRIEYNERFV